MLRSWQDFTLRYTGELNQRRVKQLFDGETKRADYFHSLITLLYAEAALAGDAG